MKSLKKNQILTKIEKKEAQKYNTELSKKFGIKFKCNNIRDYYLIKILYLLSDLINEDEMNTYYNNLMTTYYNEIPIDKDIKKKVFDITGEGIYYNYGITEGLYQYWLKYYYPTCLNFVSFLAIYSGEDLPFEMFDNTTNTAFNKFIHFIEEQSVDVIRNMVSNISKEDNTLQFIWRAKKDEKTCKICKSLNGKVYNYKPNEAHPNCRCILEICKK